MSAARKVVLVTGCSQGGIGAALCEEYANQGCIVYATSRKLETMRFEQQDIRMLKLDVVDDEDVESVVKTIIDSEGRIDVLVNNAGINCAGALLDIPMEAIKSTFDANAFATIRIAKAIFPHMAARKSGEIVNIGSLAENIPTPWNGIYSSSKAALRGISDVLWQELKPFNITVTHVSAGTVRSNIAKKALAAGIYMSEDSLYKPFAPVITQRISFSQSARSIPSAEFAKQVVAASLAPTPPRYITLGGMSSMFWLLSWLPKTWVLNYMWSWFSRLRHSR